MAREATTDKVVQLIGEAGALVAELIVFPEVFVPGTPIWIDSDLTADCSTSIAS